MADTISTIRRFTTDVVNALGLELTVSITETSEDVRVDLDGEDGDLLIRRKGEALDALQHLMNTAFRRIAGHDRHVIVDCMGFRRDKDAELRQMAKFLAEKAKTTGLAQEIGPLNPYARRIVHLAVAEDPSMSSESIGDAFMKTVVISARR